MALSLTESIARWNRDFILLGSPESETITDIFVDSLSDLINVLDAPITSDSLTVVSGTKTYSIPSIIQKVQDVRDADGVSVVYSEDTTTNEITLQNNPASGSFVVYGTFKNIRDDISTIIAALPQDLEVVWWLFVKAYSFNWANENNWLQILDNAKEQAILKRRSVNRRIDNMGAMKTLDVRGYNINDPANSDGFDVQIPGLYESDL